MVTTSKQQPHRNFRNQGPSFTTEVVPGLLPLGFMEQLGPWWHCNDRGGSRKSFGMWNGIYEAGFAMASFEWLSNTLI